MTEISLKKQLVQLQNAISERISQLKSNDPMRDWITLELEQLVKPEVAGHSFDDTNARMHAMKQLQHLVFQHFVRLHNPNFNEVVGEDQASILTIEARLPENVLQTARKLRFSIEPSLLHETPPDNDQFDPVSPTAKVVGYLRGLDKSLNVTDELSMETQGRSLMEELGIVDPKTQAAMAVLFQSRYHAMNAAMGNSEKHVSQIIEFAAGISPRGFQWSSMSPGTIYVESDLPQLMIHKAKLVRNAILSNQQQRLGVMHCCAVDVLNLDSVLRAVEIMDSSQPVTIVTEGLLLYFGREEMTQFLSHIQHILEQVENATWVTDLVTRSNLNELLGSDPGVAAGVKKVFQLTKRDVMPDNPFESEACILSFLNDHQLVAESTVSLSDVCDKLCLDEEITLEKRRKIVGSRKIWRIGSKK